MIQRSRKKSTKLQDKLLEYINKSMLNNMDLYFNNISENVEGENINEAGGVAGIPIISSIHKLYNDLNDIVKYQDQDKKSSDVINTKQRVNFGFIGSKVVDCKKHTIRIKFNDADYKFNNLISLPNSVMVFRITNIEIDDPIHAGIFREQLGNKNYYRSQPEDNIQNGHYIKGDPESIGVDVMAVNNVICPKSFYASFLHEFNHLFQDYSQHIKNSRREYTKKYKISVVIQSILKDVELSPVDKRCLQRIFSTMMNDTEINAYAAGHFGELLGENVTPDEYQSFIKRSNVWSHILNIENCINHVLEFDDDKLYKIYNIIKDTQFDELFSSDKIDKSNFKKVFKRNVLKRVQKLIDATTKVASYYFGMTTNYNNKKVN